jgi:hypothetical protein
MTFIAGLIVGLLIGALSWLGLAAWLEAQRLWAIRAGVRANQLKPALFEQLYQQASRG